MISICNEPLFFLTNIRQMEIRIKLPLNITIKMNSPHNDMIIQEENTTQIIKMQTSILSNLLLLNTTPFSMSDILVRTAHSDNIHDWQHFYSNQLVQSTHAVGNFTEVRYALYAYADNFYRNPQTFELII